jgi:hypothetical protein
VSLAPACVVVSVRIVSGSKNNHLPLGRSSGVRMSRLDFESAVARLSGGPVRCCALCVLLTMAASISPSSGSLCDVSAMKSALLVSMGRLLIFTRDERPDAEAISRASRRDRAEATCWLLMERRGDSEPRGQRNATGGRETTKERGRTQPTARGGTCGHQRRRKRKRRKMACTRLRHKKK